MPTGFADNQAFIDKSGNLSLGQSGLSDAAGDATYGYAKGDVFIPVPIGACRVAVTPSGTFGAPVGPVRVSGSVGFADVANLPISGTTAPNYFIQVPLPSYLRSVSAVLNNRVAATQHGFLVRGLRFSYAIVGAAMGTAPTVTFFTSTATNGSARATGHAVIAGTVTYENPPLDKTSGTVVTTLPTTAAALAVCKANIGTPTWITTLDQQIFAEISMPMAATGSGTIGDFAWQGALAIY
jgi:hypothetical protein